MLNRSLLSLSLSLTLVACGGTKTPTAAPPTADAGTNQIVKVGATVLLDGTHSQDPNHLPLRFAWTLSRPPSSKAALDNATLAQPSFVADVAGTYTLALTVDDGAHRSEAQPITITARQGNLAPVANAGASRSVKVGTVVELDGSASSDADGDAITYRWTLAPAPGSTAMLVAATSVEPTFTADVAGAYTVTLVVNDGKVDSAAATITITATAGSLPPVADAGGDRFVLAGATVTLDGSKSADPAGAALTYQWTLTAPATSGATLDSASAMKPTFTTDVPGAYQVALVVNDGQADSAPANITITATTKPIATITGAAKAWLGDKIALSGSGSSGWGPLTFHWTLAAPAGSAAAFDDATAPAPAFTADVAGQYVVTLVVNDGHSDSDPAHLTITASPHTAPVASLAISNLSCDLSGCASSVSGVRAGEQALLDGSKSTATDGPLTYKWTVLDPNGAAVTLTQYNFSDAYMKFTAALAGVYSVSLVVNDGFSDSPAVTQPVTVGAANHAPVANGGPDQTVLEGDTVKLSGALSSDADGDPLTYTWTFKSVATNSALTNFDIVGNDAASASFTTDIAGNYVVQLVVSDGRVNSAPVTVQISTLGIPVVSVGSSRLVATGSTVTVIGAATEDLGNITSLVWNIKSGPSTDPSQLVEATALGRASFTPGKDGVYVLELTAVDGYTNSRSADQTFTAIGVVAKPSLASGSHAVNSTLSFAQPSQVESDSLIFQWSYDPAWSGEVNVKGASNTQFYDIVPLQSGDLTVTLTVTDNNGGHASTASITVPVGS